MATRVPSEFASFIRDAGVRAFDRLGEKAEDLAAPLRIVFRAWSKLSQEQKNGLFDELIASAQIMLPDDERKPAKKKQAGKRASKKKSSAKKRTPKS